MNKQMLTKFIDDKIEKDSSKVVVEYFKLKVEKDLTDEELNEALELISIRLENLNYTVYETGESYCYKGITYEVQTNELLVAIK